jgi:hypothetical protein
MEILKIIQLSLIPFSLVNLHQKGVNTWYAFRIRKGWKHV